MSKIEASYRLSPMQQGMLFHYQLDPGSGVDIEQMVCSLREDLNVSAFMKAWNCVVARHEILRTSFRWKGLEEPLQMVHSNFNLSFELQDLRSLSPAARQSRVQEYIQLDRKKGFNLEEAPLMRLALFHMERADYQLVWTFHHIIADGRSHPIILNDVFTIYDEICQKKDWVLQQVRPYADYINWLQQQDNSESEGYWRQLLEGFKGPTPINLIRTAGNLDNENSDIDEFEIGIPEPVTTLLRTLAQENQLTLNTIIHGAWALLLSRYSGEEDVVFGTVGAGRRWAGEGAQAMVGLFINTLPLRVRVFLDKTLIPWLKEIRQLQIRLREHENTPLVKIQGWSDFPRGMNFFESILIFDIYELNAFLRSNGRGWQNREFHLLEKTGYPISLYAFAGTSLLLKVAFDRQRFDRATMSRMLDHLKTLLVGISQNPERTLSALPILTDAERHQILAEWNDTSFEYPRESCIHDLFDVQAEKSPDKGAVVFGAEKLPYRELNHRANQLAHYLRKMGVGPEVLVGIFVDRSLEMIVGLLGILKAGGAYVPLDPSFPSERLAFMLKDAQVSVLLTQEHQLSTMPEYDGQVICLDRDWEKISQESIKAPRSGASSDNLAYVIYTSGSTGKPKGVEIIHRAVVNFLFSMRNKPGLSEEDILLSVTTLSFDIAALEIFLPLITGAGTVLVSREVASDGTALLGHLRESGATVMQATPSTWQLLLEAGWENKIGLKMLCGGEALPKELASQLLERGDSLWNMYGPTETTIWSAVHRVESIERPVLIGRPIANTQVFIMDGHLQPVPVGVVGELYIGGEGLARGYLNRPDLTAERFIENPFSRAAGSRLYRTGDLARYWPDGNMEVLGRLDHQVKIRGFRIELGEIEACLSSLPGVAGAVVVVREDVSGDRRLVGYWVPKREMGPSPAELRQRLKEKLPEYMVPNAFVIIKEFPLTPNGKIDRRALPSPATHGIGEESKYAAPRTDLERTLASIWQDVLHLEKVGINDNFFEAGGHSLLATKVVSRIRKILQVEVPLKGLFDNPDIAGLAEIIKKVKANSTGTRAPAIVPLPRKALHMKLS
jgi:amino acid adenylation domain-containing protein